MKTTLEGRMLAVMFFFAAFAVENSTLLPGHGFASYLLRGGLFALALSAGLVELLASAKSK